MTPRPLHQWKTLWLGLLILASILWAWAKSMDHTYAAQVRIGSTTCAIGSAGGWLALTTESYAPGSPLPDPLTFNSSTFDGGRWFQPPFLQYRYQADITGYSSAYRSIAYWLPTLLFLLAWTSFLGYRLEKMANMKHLAASAPAPRC